MIRKILIANRGEIACRIARTCRSMGIHSVAVYSDADANALHVTTADEAVHIGGSTATESYLNVENLLDAAKRTGADAIHPGYGFLAENAAFAQSVIDAGLLWIGPPPSAIKAMGSKREAKLMLKDVPLVPGYQGDDQSDDTLINAAAEIGYPLMVKASAGGGGKGMRRVDSADGFPDALAAAKRESAQAFGDDTLILEKFVESPRHIEIQIFGDGRGKVIALGERECSIQRRHQKIIEEAPSPFVDDNLRQHMCDVAVSIGEQLGYTSAGTVEFLVDADKNFYFMEMNTRLQVEHPVTEAVYNVDLVRWQILTADPENPIDIFATYWTHPHGTAPLNRHAIEVRVYAEDAANGFLPSTGEIVRWHISKNDGLRVDSGIRSGDEISVYYDPMIAKVITYGDSRHEAIRRLDYALSHTSLMGVKNNIAFLRRTLTHPAFVAGETTTQFIDQHSDLFPTESDIPHTALIAAALADYRQSQTSQRAASTHWRNNPNRAIKTTYTAGDSAYEVRLTPHDAHTFTAQIAESTFAVRITLENNLLLGDGSLSFTVDGHRQQAVIVQRADDRWVQLDGHTYHLLWQTPLPLPGRLLAAEGSLKAPMPGQIISIHIEAGQSVTTGDTLVTMEAMKMEHRIQAPYNGTVSAVHYSVGDSVQADAVLLELEKS